MRKVDSAIINISELICENISEFDSSKRGFISQNILSQLRNLVEYIAVKIFSNGEDINPNDQSTNEESIKLLKRNGKYRFLYDFHQMLQKSVSHYTVDKESSERLMLKYYEYLHKIKSFLIDNYNLEILENLSSFPINTDEEMSDYYSSIVEKINNPEIIKVVNAITDRYYIQKIKPFIIDSKIYYEVTFTRASDKVSKFDRIIAFTHYDISDNYAVKLTIYKDSIKIIGRNMDILVISDWTVNIRPCEFGNVSKLFGDIKSVTVDLEEYQNLMHFLTVSRMTLSELLESDDVYYSEIRRNICDRLKKTRLFIILDLARDVIFHDKDGCNILRYLFHKLHNKTIKSQLARERCNKLSNMFLRFECIPFDQMPFCSSLYGHNPKLYDIFDSISIVGREHELLARLVKNNTEFEGKMFTKIEELNCNEDSVELLNHFNNSLYYKHFLRKLKVFNNHMYIEEYASKCNEIINKLQELSSVGVKQYAEYVKAWLSDEAYEIDDNLKVNILESMFEKSSVAMIYGSAGTGKTTMISHISNLWSEQRKLYLANTHPAVDNLRRRVNVKNSNYSTIAKFTSSNSIHSEFDIIFIDECSTVSNMDMHYILANAKYKLLILVGDTFQIEAITFGNWFSIVKFFLPKYAIFELTYTYRTKNKDLLMVWERVRNYSDSILESLVKFEMTFKLNETIFENTEKDEIVLCLNYDGLYGINNVNRFLQSGNENESIQWETNIYKVGDPVLFNDSMMFSPLIHNNSKGRIVKVKKETEMIKFSIELDKVVNGIEASKYNFVLEDLSENGNSIISFAIYKKQNTDNDDETEKLPTHVPFQVAYAISVHKAQGLEYNSVKIVLSNEVEERVTHNVFYTAITRAKDKLRIYWSPETEKAILERFKMIDNKKDAYLLSQLYNIAIHQS